VVATIDKQVSVSVPKRDDRTIQELKRALANMLERKGSGDSAAGVVTSILHSDIAELAPLAIKVAGMYPLHTEAIAVWIFDVLPGDKAAEQALLSALSAGPREAMVWLNVWHANSRRHPLKEAHAKRIRESSNILARLAMLVFFPEGLSEAQAEDLLRQAKRVRGSISLEQVRPLVEQLDDPSYRRREMAKQQIVDFGDRAVPILQGLAGKVASAEVASRIAAVTEQIKDNPAETAEARFVEYVKAQLAHFENAERVLEALADNAPEARITLTAKQALTEFRAEKKARPLKK